MYRLVDGTSESDETPAAKAKKGREKTTSTTRTETGGRAKRTRNPSREKEEGREKKRERTGRGHSGRALELLELVCVSWTAARRCFFWPGGVETSRCSSLFFFFFFFFWRQKSVKVRLLFKKIWSLALLRRLFCLLRLWVPLLFFSLLFPPWCLSGWRFVCVFWGFLRLRHGRRRS